MVKTGVLDNTTYHLNGLKGGLGNDGSYCGRNCVNQAGVEANSNSQLLFPNAETASNKGSITSSWS